MMHASETPCDKTFSLVVLGLCESTPIRLTLERQRQIVA
jgi:hypothetical protein